MTQNTWYARHCARCGATLSLRFPGWGASLGPLLTLPTLGAAVLFLILGTFAVTATLRHRRSVELERSAQALVHQAVRTAVSGQAASARDQLLRIVADRPELEQVLIHLLVRSGNALAKAAKARQPNVDAELGDWDEAADRYARAAVVFELAFTVGHRDALELWADATCARGECYLMAAAPERAAAAFREASEIYGRAASALRAAGRSSASERALRNRNDSLGKERLARARASKATEDHP